MLKIELINHGTLKSAFESISSIIDEITMTADEESLHLAALSRDHITFINLDLSKEFFDTYECRTPGKFAVDCNDFFTILKKCKKNEILELDVDESAVTMIFKGDATRKFKIRQIDMEYDSPTPPLIEYSCKISIPSGLMKDYINDMTIFSDKIDFLVDEDYLRIRGDGQMGDGEIQYIHGENISQVIKSCFSIPKLQDIFKASKFSEESEIHLGDDMPIKVDFNLVTGDGKLSYLLAPRLETED